jgi:hypothetical protein
MVKNQNEARVAFSEMLHEFLVEKFGEENVTLVGTNEYAFVFGTVENKHGTFDMVLDVKPTAKNYEDTTRSKKVVEAFDRVTAGELYAMKVKEKEEKKAASRFAFAASRFAFSAAKKKEK